MLYRAARDHFSSKTIMFFQIVEIIACYKQLI
jgi:hypothetical protein